jgi:hypothetical protein
MSTSTFFRLCSRAPRMLILSMCRILPCRDGGDTAAEKYRPVHGDRPGHAVLWGLWPGLPSSGRAILPGFL